MFLTGGYLSLQISEHTSAVIESYYANQSNSSTISQGQNARWDGVAAYLIHDITKEWGVRLRGRNLRRCERYGHLSRHDRVPAKG